MSHQRYKTNPFLEQLSIPVRGKQISISPLGGAEHNILVNQSTGEIHGTQITSYKKVDAEQFVKLFTANIGLTFNLTSAGIKCFSVVLWTMQSRAISKDEIFLDAFLLDDFVAHHECDSQPLKLSLATFKRGLNDLENAQIIAKTQRQGCYFLNPNFLFNGSRIAFTTLIEREDKPTTNNKTIGEIKR